MTRIAWCSTASSNPRRIRALGRPSCSKDPVVLSGPGFGRRGDILAAGPPIRLNSQSVSRVLALARALEGIRFPPLALRAGTVCTLENGAIPGGRLRPNGSRSYDSTTVYRQVAAGEPVGAKRRQQHFLDLFELLGQPTPAEAEPIGTWYTFEMGVSKADVGEGSADVWRRGSDVGPPDRPVRSTIPELSSGPAYRCRPPISRAVGGHQRHESLQNSFHLAVRLFVVAVPWANWSET